MKGSYLRPLTLTESEKLGWYFRKNRKKKSPKFCKGSFFLRTVYFRGTAILCLFDTSALFFQPNALVTMVQNWFPTCLLFLPPLPPPTWPCFTMQDSVVRLQINSSSTAGHCSVIDLPVKETGIPSVPTVYELLTALWKMLSSCTLALLTHKNCI